MNARLINKNARASAAESGEDGHADHLPATSIDPSLENLARALLALGSTEEACRFLRDLCTPGEIAALSERWHVVRLLDKGALSYRDIHDETGVSTTTVSRVARFLFNEPHRGYRLVLDRLGRRDSGQKASPRRNSEVGQTRR